MRAGAPAVVAAGGVGVPARKWARVVEKLDDAHLPAAGACPFVIVDRPGLGRRGGRRFGDVPEFADEVARVVHDLRRCREAGASPVILVAHSAAGFLAEGAVRSNPGLVDGVLLLDVSVVEDAHLPLPLLRAFPLADVVYGRVSHAVGLVLEPLVRWAWPTMRRGEVASLLLENAVFGRWARDLRDLRAVDAAIGRVAGLAGPAGPEVRGGSPPSPPSPTSWRCRSGSCARAPRPKPRWPALRPSMPPMPPPTSWWPHPAAETRTCGRGATSREASATARIRWTWLSSRRARTWS